MYINYLCAEPVFVFALMYSTVLLTNLAFQFTHASLQLGTGSDGVITLATLTNIFSQRESGTASPLLETGF